MTHNTHSNFFSEKWSGIISALIIQVKSIVVSWCAFDTKISINIQWKVDLQNKHYSEKNNNKYFLDIWNLIFNQQKNL